MMTFDRDKIEEILHRENLKIAPLSKRVIAFLIDDCLISVLIFFMFFSQFSKADDQVAVVELTRSLLIYVILLRFVYQSLFTYLFGASLGKIIMKIRIIQISDLDTPDLLNAICRSFFKELGQFLMFIGYLFALGDPFLRTLHDRIVKSVVIMQD